MTAGAANFQKALEKGAWAVFRKHGGVLRMADAPREGIAHPLRHACVTPADSKSSPAASTGSPPPRSFFTRSCNSSPPTAATGGGLTPVTPNRKLAEVVSVPVLAQFPPSEPGPSSYIARYALT